MQFRSMTDFLVSWFEHRLKEPSLKWSARYLKNSRNPIGSGIAERQGGAYSSVGRATDF
jgi:hypothetical protein